LKERVITRHDRKGRRRIRSLLKEDTYLILVVQDFEVKMFEEIVFCLGFSFHDTRLVNGTDETTKRKTV
jgi:hypothetical protein